MIRLRHMVKIGPSPREICGLSAMDEVTFAPMDALADGLGGLVVSLTKPLGEVMGGNYNYFAEGDVLLAKVTPCFENGKKAIAYGLSNGVGFATSEVHVIRPDRTKINTRFLRYLFCSEDFRAGGMKSMTGAGGLRRISENGVLDYRPRVTDLHTQSIIADFLDCETARIDQLIEKKQRFVSLLEEKNLAQITLEIIGFPVIGNRSKQSRNRFIGNFPDLWEDAQLKHLVRPGTSITYGIVQAGSEYEGGIPYIRTGDMKGEELPIDGYPRTSPEIEKSYARSRLEKGDLVIAIRATVGKCLPVPDELIGANLTQGTAKISPGPRVDRDFLLYAIQSKPSQAFLEESLKGATFKEITLDRLRRLVLPVPPLNEQRQIVNRLHISGALFKKATRTTVKSIDRLREFRAALVNAAVTGQIDVTTWRKKGQTDRRLERIAEA